MKGNLNSLCTRVPKWIAVCLCVAFCGASLWAQTSATGAIAGAVTDSSGGVIPNATVTATSTDTGQARTATTAADGTYRFSLLPPGQYKVSFSANGFKTEEVPDLNVAVTETPVLNRILQVGGAAEQITVEANVETIQTSSSTLGTVVDSQAVVAIPLTTRNYTNLLALTAGANASVPNATGLGRGTLEIAVNGASTNMNSFQMDGVNIETAGSGGTTTEGFYSTFAIPNPDALQEFKIQTSLYDASYGRNVGASVNVITKSGTNQFHGTAFEFFRNTDLNANDFFRNRTCGANPTLCASAGGNKLVFNQNQFGGVAGGPIKKDKLFGFGSYQQTWQKNGIATQGYASGINLPAIPLGSRTAAGFQAALGAQFCKSPTQAGGTQVACDGSNINPYALRLLQATVPGGGYFMPGSSIAGATQSGVSYSIPAYDKEYQGLLNFDYILNSKNTISARFFKSQELQNYAFASAGNAPGTPGSSAYGYTTGILRLTTIVSNTFVNEVRGSIERSPEFITQAPPASTYANVLAPGDPFLEGPNGNFLNPNIPNSPIIKIAGLLNTGGSTTYPVLQASTQYQWADQISWTHGAHTIRAGGEYEKTDWVWDFLGLEQGVESYQTFSDFLIGLPGNCGPAVAGICNGSTVGSNMLNSTNYADRSSGSLGIIHNFRVVDANAFVQDDWKVSKRLTVNLGLRWEYDGLPSDKYGNIGTIWPNSIVGVPSTTAIPTPGVYSVPAGSSQLGFAVANNYPAGTYGPLPAQVALSSLPYASQNSVPRDDFAPRLGFAWQPPIGHDKLVLRGGYGFFFNRISADTMIHSVIESPPYDEHLDQSGVGNSFASEAQPFQPTPLGVFPARWVNFSQGSSPFNQSSTITAGAMANNYLTPLVYSWNLNTQYAITPSLVLEVGYVGAHGIHQPVSAHAINEAQLATPGNPVWGLVATNTTNNVNLRVPFLGFGATGLQVAGTDGDYKSNGLQATLRKSLSHGLTFSAAYSWTRAFSDFVSNGDSGDTRNYTQQYGLNTGYRPERFVINYSYALPGSNLKGIGGKVLGGWTLAGVTTIQGGNPLTLTDNRGGSIFGMNASSLVVSRAQMAPGSTYADLVTSGGVESRLGGISGGPGYINATALVPLTCSNTTGTPTAASTSCVGATPGVAGTGGTGWGNSGIGVIMGPGQFNFDATLGKITRVGGVHENAILNFRVEFFNMLNHPQFSTPASLEFSSSAFGQITSASVNPRLIQLALKYQF